MKIRKEIAAGLAKCLLAAAVLQTSLPAVPAVLAAEEDNTSTTEQTEQLPTHLLNGSFEVPKLGDGNYECPAGYGDANGCSNGWGVHRIECMKANLNNDEKLGWMTTDFDQKMEYIRSGEANNGATGGFLNKQYHIEGASDGDQFAELCCEDQACLYQNIATKPGAIYEWSLDHAARGEENHTEPEIMAVFIGPKQSYDLKKAEATQWGQIKRDIFMWMGELLESSYPTEAYAQTAEPINVYSKKALPPLAEITEDNYTQYFKTDISEGNAGEWAEWKCWIIKDTPVAKKEGAENHSQINSWHSYKGTYTIPASQKETTFAFSALSGNFMTDGSGRINNGNLLDNIQFAVKYPLTVTTTPGGSGKVCETGKADVEVTSSNPHNNVNYYEGTNLTVEAVPKEQCEFVGAYIDGTFFPVTDTGKFTAKDAASGTYTAAVTMDQVRTMRLVFAQNSTIMFYPNGGTFNGSADTTVITMGVSSESDEVQSYTPNDKTIVSPNNNEKIKFVGWDVALNNSQDGTMTTINNDVIITYDANETTGEAKLNAEYTTVNQTGSEKQKYTTDAAKGMTFFARWQYEQRATAMTKGASDGSYNPNSTGGTVAVSGTWNNSITNDDTNSVSYGYARTTDKEVTMTAAPKDGYLFMGWYDAEGKLVSKEKEYIYSNEHGEVHEYFARFCAAVNPYLSFISENVKPDTTDATFTGGSHNKYGEQMTLNATQTGGEKYGNTISTGFITTQSYSEGTYDKCLWQINLPASGTYVKRAGYNDTSVLADSENVGYNKGAIYKVDENMGTESIRVITAIPTTITPNGGGVILGLILDNIYAPNAQAAADLISSTDSNDYDTEDFGDQYMFESTSGNEYNYYERESVQ